MPEASRSIADARLEEHERAGGGRIVTACASSLLAFRRRAGARARATKGARPFPIDDLVTYLARAARPWRAV
jgi:hypothetical protein